MVEFVGFSLISLLGILDFKGLTAQRLHKSFGVKGLISICLGSKNEYFTESFVAQYLERIKVTIF
jgi:hypothetical protein